MMSIECNSTSPNRPAAADRSLLVFPGHFGGHSACRVDDDGEGAFIIRDWADLARI